MTETVSALRTGDLECPLCLRIYWDPDVTPCGHTFCSNCLERTLDHDPKCPLCKQSLVEFLELRQGAKREDFTDKQLTRIIRRWLPEEHQDRFEAVSSRIFLKKEDFLKSNSSFSINLSFRLEKKSKKCFSAFQFSSVH